MSEVLLSGKSGVLPTYTVSTSMLSTSTVGGIVFDDIVTRRQQPSSQSFGDILAQLFNRKIDGVDDVVRKLT